MKFRQYDRKRDRDMDPARTAGTERAGDMWSAAPGGFWIIPRPRLEGEPSCLLAHKSPDGTYYVISAEQDGAGNTG